MFACAALSLLAACEARIQQPQPGASAGGESASAGGSGGAGGGIASTGDLSNLDVYTRLKPTCGGCHTVDMRPFFGSLEAFENLIVYDTKYVVPMDPAGSTLLAMLRGTAAKPMPPVPSAPFSGLEAERKTFITMTELEEWIRRLQPRTVPVVIDPPLVRRKTAEQVQAALYQQLGLTEADFYDAAFNVRGGDAYAVRSPDATPYADSTGQGATLFVSLGGPHRLEGKWRNDGVTPGFLQALTHTSQAWCRAAVTKPGNTAVLSRATLADASTTAPGAAAIKANIAELYLKLLGEPAPQAEVDDLFTNVFVRYESKGAATAWTAVCAALIRDPLWILY
ncbi:MAG: hypothetical protein JNK82_13455 [Myxococcaceae bacterium]|nr:hypothetical protein [Myxococcaceae bacterium]